MSTTISPVRLRLWTAVSLVIGCVIGSGVFVKPGKVLAAAGSSNGALLAWVFGGVMSLAGGLTAAEIAFRIPKTGGVYVYLEELYGKAVGFVCGWVQVLIYGPGLMAALSLYFGSLFAQFFGLPATQQKPIALVTLYLLAVLNARSARASGALSDATTALKLLPIFIIGVGGLVMGNAAIFNQELPHPEKAAGLGAAVLACLWAYDGWMQVTNIAGEIDNPARNLPRAIVVGLATVMTAYLLVNLSLFHVLLPTELASLNEKAASVAATKLFGSVGGKLLSLGILISIFGCLNGNILTLTRVLYAIASRGTFPMRERFANLHPIYQTPIGSIVAKVTIATVMILLLDPDRITDLAMFSMYLFYSLVFIGIFRVRSRHGVPAAGEYRVPLYPIVPLIAFGGCLFIISGMLRQAPKDAALSVGIALLGFPVHALLSRRGGTSDSASA